MNALLADQVLPYYFTSGPAPIIVFDSVFVVFMLSELWIGRHRPVEGAQDRDRGSRSAVFAGLFFTYGGMFAVSFGLPNTVLTQGRLPVFAVGIVVAVAGQALRVWSVIRLGASFTYTVHTAADQRVIDTGPYRFIRHPAYTGGYLFALGMAVALTDWLAPSMTIFLMVGYAWRIRVEETALAAALGNQYQRYMSKTKRVIPFLV